MPYIDNAGIRIHYEVEGTVLDHLGFATTRYFGYSMGALIGYGMAR